MIDEINEAMKAGDFARAEELVNSITDHREVHQISTWFAAAGEFALSKELHRRSEELRLGLIPVPFRFVDEGEQPS